MFGPVVNIVSIADALTAISKEKKVINAELNTDLHSIKTFKGNKKTVFFSNKADRCLYAAMVALAENCLLFMKQHLNAAFVEIHKLENCLRSKDINRIALFFILQYEDTQAMSKTIFKFLSLNFPRLLMPVFNYLIGNEFIKKIDFSSEEAFEIIADAVLTFKDLDLFYTITNYLSLAGQNITAIINYKTKNDNNTLLHLIFWNEVLPISSKVQLINNLLQQGANPNLKNSQNQSFNQMVDKNDKLNKELNLVIGKYSLNY